MPRLMLTDNAWKLISSIMSFTGRTYQKKQHRMTAEGILYRLRTGIPWRDLPADFGLWNSVFRRFNLWSKKGILTAVFNIITKDPDMDWLFIDGSIVRAHQHSTGAATDNHESIGKSRGGNSTKIHLAVDSGGLPVYFELSGGQVHDIVHAESLVANSPEAKTIVADKGYDSQNLRDFIEKKGAKVEIPRRKNSKQGNEDMDWALYKYRHLVENAFGIIKNNRAIATRYDKLERNYNSMVALAFSLMWIPIWVD
jgi:transposase